MSRKNKLKRNRRSITVQFTNPECRVMFNVMECLVSDVYEVGGRYSCNNCICH